MGRVTKTVCSAVHRVGIDFFADQMQLFRRRRGGFSMVPASRSRQVSPSAFFAPQEGRLAEGHEKEMSILSPEIPSPIDNDPLGK